MKFGKIVLRSLITAALVVVGAAVEAEACEPNLSVYNETGHDLHAAPLLVQVQKRGFSQWAIACLPPIKTLEADASGAKKSWNKLCNPTGGAVGQKIQYKLYVKKAGQPDSAYQRVKTHKRQCQRRMRVVIKYDAARDRYYAEKK